MNMNWMKKGLNGSKKFLQSLAGLVMIQKRGSKFEEKPLLAGWVVLTFLLSCSFVFLFLSPGIAFLVLALALGYFKISAEEIKYPNVAVFYRFGRLAGVLGPGLHVGAPGIWVIEKLPRDAIVFDLPAETMYTVDDSEIKVKVIAAVQVGEKMTHLRKFLMLPEGKDNSDKKAQAVMFFSALILDAMKSVVGEKTFQQLNRGQDEAADEAIKHLRKELRKYGCKLLSLGIKDIENKVESKARERIVMAEALGEEARRVSEPLENNMPAAWVMIASTLASTIGRAIADIFGSNNEGGKRRKQERKNPASAANAVKDAVQNLIPGGGDQ